MNRGANQRGRRAATVEPQLNAPAELTLSAVSSRQPPTRTDEPASRPAQLPIWQPLEWSGEIPVPYNVIPY